MSIVEQGVTRGIGGLILLLRARDAHAFGKQRADVYAQSGDADALASAYINTRMTGTPSSASERMKDYAYKKELDGNMRHFSNSVKGYWYGVFKMCSYNVMPIGLGLLALLGTNKYVRGVSAGLALGFIGLGWFKERHGAGYHDSLNTKFIDPAI
jgi:hypothetical protein